MLLSAEVMRFFLLACVVGMAFLAGLFLKGRSLSLHGYLGWGLLVVLVPLLGPFLTILSCPGTPLLRAERLRRRRARTALRRSDPTSDHL